MNRLLKTFLFLFLALGLYNVSFAFEIGNTNINNTNYSIDYEVGSIEIFENGISKNIFESNKLNGCDIKFFNYYSLNNKRWSFYCGTQGVFCENVDNDFGNGCGTFNNSNGDFYSNSGTNEIFYNQFGDNRFINNYGGQYSRTSNTPTGDYYNFLNGNNYIIFGTDVFNINSGINIGVSLGSPEVIENGIFYNIWDVFNNDTGESLVGDLYFDVSYLSGSTIVDTVRTDKYNYGFDVTQKITYPYHPKVGNYFIEPIFIYNNDEYNLENTNSIGFYYNVTVAEKPANIDLTLARGTLKSVFDIDRDGDGAISILESTLALVTIGQNIISAIGERIDGIFSFIDELMNIGNTTNNNGFSFLNIIGINTVNADFSIANEITTMSDNSNNNSIGKFQKSILYLVYFFVFIILLFLIFKK